MSTIADIHGRQILDSRGNPTVEVEVTLIDAGGQTRTYGWVARKLGRPGAARAVGQALKANPFAPTVPCHRVVRSDGSLGGYNGTGGTARKRRMLEREGALQGLRRR